jgi:hypothetical protein
MAEQRLRAQAQTGPPGHHAPGQGPLGALAPDGTGPPREAHFSDAQEAYLGVLDLINTLEEETGIPFATLHTLGGDALAWERFTIEKGIKQQATGS